jgi:hypothetical protein
MGRGVKHRFWKASDLEGCFGGLEKTHQKIFNYMIKFEIIHAEPQPALDNRFSLKA